MILSETICKPMLSVGVATLRPRLLRDESCGFVWARLYRFSEAHSQAEISSPTLALLMWGFRQRRRPGGSLRNFPLTTHDS